jgi:hypothetical protein
LTGYDILSTDPNTAHAQLRWADGTPSGFAIKSISPATGTMDVTFELPASATGIAEHPTVPKDLALHQNYPNPFNPSTTIGYTIAGTGHEEAGNRWVKLAVYDMLGREVAVLVDEQKAPGSHGAQWNATGFASGVYLYRLTAGRYTEVCKMILMR